MVVNPRSVKCRKGLHRGLYTVHARLIQDHREEVIGMVGKDPAGERPGWMVAHRAGVASEWATGIYRTRREAVQVLIDRLNNNGWCGCGWCGTTTMPLDSTGHCEDCTNG